MLDKLEETSFGLEICIKIKWKNRRVKNWTRDEKKQETKKEKKTIEKKNWVDLSDIYIQQGHVVVVVDIVACWPPKN